MTVEEDDVLAAWPLVEKILYQAVLDIPRGYGQTICGVYAGESKSEWAAADEVHKMTWAAFITLMAIDAYKESVAATPVGEM